jgi:hypothetical protein
MKNKLKTLNQFLDQYDLDLTDFYAISLSSSYIVLQGRINETRDLVKEIIIDPLNRNMQVKSSLDLELDIYFDYNGQKFNIYLT